MKGLLRIANIIFPILFKTYMNLLKLPVLITVEVNLFKRGYTQAFMPQKPLNYENMTCYAISQASTSLQRPSSGLGILYSYDALRLHISLINYQILHPWGTCEGEFLSLLLTAV